MFPCIKFSAPKVFNRINTAILVMFHKFYMTICLLVNCVLLNSQGDSNEYTQYTIFSIQKKFTLNDFKSVAMDFFLGTEEKIRNSHRKRAISVRAPEVLLYMLWCIRSI